jgi:hypothetical protein
MARSDDSLPSLASEQANSTINEYNLRTAQLHGIDPSTICRMLSHGDETQLS